MEYINQVIKLISEIAGWKRSHKSNLISFPEYATGKKSSNVGSGKSWTERYDMQF